MHFAAALVALTLFSTSASTVVCELICAAEWCHHARLPQPRLLNHHQDGTADAAANARLEHQHGNDGSAANRSTVAAPDDRGQSGADRCHSRELIDADGTFASVEPDDCRRTVDAAVAAVPREKAPPAGIAALPRTPSPIAVARAAVAAPVPCGSLDRLSATVPLRI